MGSALGENTIRAVDDWRKILSDSVVSAGRLQRSTGIKAQSVRPVIDRYPMRINPYFLSLIRTLHDPIGRQVIPDPAELEEKGVSKDVYADDPFCEEALSPVGSLVHRHPDRVLFIVSGICAVYCRHCMRKRNAGRKSAVTGDAVRRAVDYIGRAGQVREVILSGGDPLLLRDAFLEEILDRVAAIPHVKRLRIHTRTPGVLPARITRSLVEILGRFSPLFINIQFNHPAELTREAADACGMLADAGIVLGSQSVLLNGVNDDENVLAQLMEKLLSLRVRPYYLHHPDPVRGTAHFGVSLERGIEIMRKIRADLPGMAIPHYVVDLPGGRGKVPAEEVFAARERERK